MSTPLKNAAYNVARFFYLLGEAFSNTRSNFYYHIIKKHTIDRTPELTFDDDLAELGFTATVTKGSITDEVDEGFARIYEFERRDIKDILPEVHTIDIMKNGEKSCSLKFMHRDNASTGLISYTGNNRMIIISGGDVAWKLKAKNLGNGTFTIEEADGNTLALSKVKPNTIEDGNIT